MTTGEVLFLSIAAIIAVIFALINGISFMVKSRDTDTVTGTIMSVYSTNKGDEYFRNSKWATVAYKVNGRMYTSSNRVQVPAVSQIGHKVLVRYDKEHPEKLYHFSLKKMIAGLTVAIICLFLVLLNR